MVSHVRQCKESGTRKIDDGGGDPCDNNDEQNQREPLSFREIEQLTQCEIGEQDNEQRRSKMQQSRQNNGEGEHAVGKSSGRNHNSSISCRSSFHDEAKFFTSLRMTTEESVCFGRGRLTGLGFGAFFQR